MVFRLPGYIYKYIYIYTHTQPAIKKIRKVFFPTFFSHFFDAVIKLTFWWPMIFNCFWWPNFGSSKQHTLHECVCEGGSCCTFLAKRRRSKQVPFGEMVFNLRWVSKLWLMSWWNKSGCCFILGLHRCFLEWQPATSTLCLQICRLLFQMRIYEGTKSQTMPDTST